jgi:hypothetical protein
LKEEATRKVKPSKNIQVSITTRKNENIRRYQTLSSKGKSRMVWEVWKS